MEKALKHLRYLFSKEKIYRKKEDVEALNQVIEGFNSMQSQILKRNNLFLKMFLHEFLRQTSLKGNSSKDAISEIHKILETTTEEYHHKMRNEIPYLRFKALSDDLGLIPLYEIKEGQIRVNNSEEVLKKNEELIAKHEKKLKRALTTEYSQEELDAFLRQYLNQTILKYSSYD